MIFDGLVEDKPSHRFPKDTASEYRLNLDKIIATIDYSRCEKISTDASNIPHECANNSSTSETPLNFSENNNVGEEEKVDLEKAQVSRFVDKPEEMDSVETTNCNGDKGSAEQVEVVTILDNQSSEKPSKSEVKEICNELKRLRINPDPCLGVVKKYWDNVAAAIARVKEAIKDDWCDNPTGLFIASCKNGEKPKNSVTSEVSDWFEWARRERIVLGMSGGVVYTPDGEAVKVEEMIRKFPVN